MEQRWQAAGKQPDTRTLNNTKGLLAIRGRSLLLHQTL